MLGSFILTSIVLESTPGPNMAYLAVVGATAGRRAGYAAVAGVALGLFLVGIAAALGLSALILAWPLAYEIMRWCGVAYLFWLAWDGWREAEAATDETAPLTSPLLFFRRGLITNLLNPKAALFFVTVLPGFLNPALATAPQAIWLTCLYVLIATLIHCVIVTIADAARGFLTDPKRNRLLRRVLSGLLALIALWLAVSTGRG